MQHVHSMQYVHSIQRFWSHPQMMHNGQQIRRTAEWDNKFDRDCISSNANKILSFIYGFMDISLVYTRMWWKSLAKSTEVYVQLLLFRAGTGSLGSGQGQGYGRVMVGWHIVHNLVMAVHLMIIGLYAKINDEAIQQSKSRATFMHSRVMPQSWAANARYP